MRRPAPPAVHPFQVPSTAATNRNISFKYSQVNPKGISLYFLTRENLQISNINPALRLETFLFVGRQVPTQPPSQLCARLASSPTLGRSFYLSDSFSLLMKTSDPLVNIQLNIGRSLKQLIEPTFRLADRTSSPFPFLGRSKLRHIRTKSFLITQIATTCVLFVF